VNSIILLELCGFLSLAHQDQDRGGTTEQRVAAAFVGLPCGNEMRQALLEEVLVNFDICHSWSRVVGDGRFEVGRKGELEEGEGRAGFAINVDF
jgi:hypothetical protein